MVTHTFFCSDIFCSCSNCSEASFSCVKAVASCLDLFRSYSFAVASCLDRTPFWCSRSSVLDSAKSRSRSDLWVFFSKRFITSLSFWFSSARGSILFINWCW